jgi:hypothetical protein
MSSVSDVITAPLHPFSPAAIFVPFNLALPFAIVTDGPCRYPFPFSRFLSSGLILVGSKVVDDGGNGLLSAVRDMTFDKMAVLELVTQVLLRSVDRIQAKITTTIVIATSTTASVTAKTMTIPSSSRRRPNCSLPAFNWRPSMASSMTSSEDGGTVNGTPRLTTR